MPAPPAAAPWSHDRRKNRYLSIVAENPEAAVSFRVELTAVGPPECYENDPPGDAYPHPNPGDCPTWP